MISSLVSQTNELDAMQRRMAVYIFSFNRASHLDWSIETTLACMPGFSCIVVDDNSDDVATIEVLKKWDSRIIRLSVPKAYGEKKTGGLYPNMTLALNHAIAMGHDYALFTQDDMQFIRSFEPSDVELMETYFAAHPSAIQLLVHFVKRPEDGRPITDHWTLDDSGTAYLRTEHNRHDKGNFCAGGIFDLARTKAVLGKFRMSEKENGIFAREAGVYYGFSRQPLITYMPAPISFRGKRRSLEHRFYEKLGGAGFHPVDLMTAQEARRFLERGPEAAPFAEDFLRCPTAPAPGNWAAGGGPYLVVARGGWRRALFRTMDGVKRLIKHVVVRKTGPKAGR